MKKDNEPMAKETQREKLAQIREMLFESLTAAGMPLPDVGLPTHIEIINHLHVLIDLLKRGDLDQHGRDLLQNQAFGLWSLLATEIGGALLNDESLDSMTNPDDPSLLRPQLKFLCKLQNVSIPPTHRSAVDPVAIFLPRQLFEHLLNSLDALDAGEILPILSPRSSSRHGNSYQWDLMRRRALEHVAFLHGQGVGKGIAQRRVGAAMKNVSAKTLKEWESAMISNPFHQQEIASAFSAGKLAVTFSVDPDYGRPGSSDDIDANALAKLEILERDPLGEFGRRYHAEFGLRHNSPAS